MLGCCEITSAVALTPISPLCLQENIDDYVAKFAVAADAVMEMLNYLLS